MNLKSRYSLSGVQTASTAPQEAFIKRSVEILGQDDRVVAVYLVGGFAVGLGDPWSDVDLHCVIRDDSVADLATSWTDLAGSLAPLAYTEPFPAFVPGQPAPIGGICITPEWLHFDLLIYPQSKLDLAKLEGIVPLFDRGGHLPDTPVPRRARSREPFFPVSAVQMFLYQLGNMVGIIGRNEPIPGSNGVVLARDIALVTVLLAEQGIEAANDHKVWMFPFSKRLRAYLTDEQNMLLESLPPIGPTLDSIIDGYVALAEVFLPRAKRLAERTGATWPTAYEEASIGYFERSLGATIRR